MDAAPAASLFNQGEVVKLYYYIEGRSELVISDNDESGFFTEIEVDDEFGKKALLAQEAWDSISASVLKKIG